MSFMLVLALLSGPAGVTTTVSDSSMVAFTVRPALAFDTVTHDSVDYIRFRDVSTTDSTGYPEVPRLTCMVAVPDSVDPEVGWSVYGDRALSSLPVYPAPDDSVGNDRTPMIVEVFTQDSTAYASDSWWPEHPVEVAGEMRLCEQRILLVDVFPARFLASADSLRLASGVSVSVRFDNSEAVWSDVGLGALQATSRDSWIVGYHPVQPPQVPVPTVFRDFDLQTGPPRVPDYVILVAEGLDGPHIDSLAWHRVGLNGMDVAVVTTGEVMDEFGGGGQALTDDIIRDFTETMWTWGQPASKRPSYLLLAGDHGGPDYAGEDWFLPTHEYADDPGSLPENMYANDEWYAYFDCLGEVPDNDFPDMMVGRLSVVGADTLQAMIDAIIACEEPVTSQPVVDRRRRVVRLAGKGDDISDSFNQIYHEWHPNAEWTRDLCGWLDYEFSNAYCGDGRSWTDMDGSVYSSAGYRDFCIDRFSEGAGVIFYSDHGDCHMFSAGLEWWPRFCDYTKGARDSTFNCLRAQELSPSQYHTPPFVLMLCCGSGTFNHTRELHPEGNPWPVLCKDDEPPTFPPYDFSTRCLAEAVHRNTSCPSAGVFAGSCASSTWSYSKYGKGIMEAVWRFGESRLGEAIAGARARRFSAGSNARALGQFNLLGDPALDIGDRVRYPGKCDLVIAPADVWASDYPRLTGDGLEADISLTVRNNGGDASGPFDITLTVSYDGGMDTYQLFSSGLDAGEEEDYRQTWSTTDFDPPGTVTVYAHADPDGDCDDSWTANNSVTVMKELWDIYPLEDGWPLQAGGVISQPPMLVDLDDDPDLEVVVVAGDMLEAYQPDGSLLWRNEEVALSSSAAPLAADLDGDGSLEVTAASPGGLGVFDESGRRLGTLSGAGAWPYAVADMHATAGLELAVGDGETLRLYRWDPSGQQFVRIDSHSYTFGGNPSGKSMACADLDGDGYCESVYSCTYGTAQEPYLSVAAYDWNDDMELSTHTWETPGYTSETPGSNPLAVGLLAGSAEVGVPMGQYDPQKPGSYPGRLVDPLSPAAPIDCEPGNVASSAVKFGLFADWNQLVTGLDAFVIPAENQCLAWDDAGNALPDWPVDYSGGEFDPNAVTPPALGDLDGDGWADVLSSTREDANGVVVSLDRDGRPLEAPNFPFILPEEVDVSSGFAVADIDRDGKIEVVFGTGEGMLHVWELGACDTDYAPWPQHRHDAGRTGVLE